jgi:hypothetical protein
MATSIDNTTEINDYREPNAFKGISFSTFKKTDVRKELLNSLTQSKIEPACYWSAELICAGHFSELWDIIIYFYSRCIHVGNPKMATYLDLRLTQFKEIIRNGYAQRMMALRNNHKIRRMFCEIMCVLCESNKKHKFGDIKIRKEEFDFTNLTDRFKAPSVEFAETVFRAEDPKNLFIAVNELAYNLSDKVKNNVDACYWVEWILEFEQACKARKEKCICERRSSMPVDNCRQLDIVWIIWDMFISQVQNNKIMHKIVMSLLSLFTIQYTNACARRRKYVLFCIIELLTTPVSLDCDIVRDKEKVGLIMSKIDTVYKQIKVNEHSPNTDYLFHNVSACNLEKTIAKLEQMNSFGETFVPRL